MKLQEKINHKLPTRKIALIFVGIFLVGVFVYGVFFFNNSISGKTIFEIGKTYLGSNVLEKALKPSLKEEKSPPGLSENVSEKDNEKTDSKKIKEVDIPATSSRGGSKKKEIPEESEIILNETEVNLTEEINETNLTVEINGTSIFSDEEMIILFHEFGENILITTTKSEFINERIVLRYELGDYWYEPSYDAFIGEEKLIYLMEADRIRWIRDIISELSNEIVVEELEVYLKDYSI